MTTTCANPPNASNFPQISLPSTPTDLPDANPVILLVPKNAGSWNNITIIMSAPGVQVDVSGDLVSTINNGSWSGGLWATDIFGHSSNTKNYLEITSPVTAIRFTNSTGSDQKVIVKVI